MIYPPNQKPPLWPIDPGIIAYNCQQAGMPHPVLAMPMWEGAGNRALDYSGRGNHGELIGGETRVSDGIDLDGTDDFISTGNVDLSSTDKITLSIGIKPDVVNSDVVFLEMSENYNSYQDSFIMYFDSLGNVYIGEKGNSDYAMWGTTSVLTAGTQTHLTAVFDKSLVSGEAKGYFDGNVDGAVTDDGNNTNNFGNRPIYIGSRAGSSLFFDGTIYYFNIFNTALSASQAKFLTDNPYFMYQIPEELYGYVAGAPPVGAIINQFQHLNLGSDLFNGTLI